MQDFIRCLLKHFQVQRVQKVQHVFVIPINVVPAFCVTHVPCRIPLIIIICFNSCAHGVLKVKKIKVCHFLTHPHLILITYASLLSYWSDRDAVT